MKKLVMVLLFGILPVLAQGADDLLKQARDLEKKASALLDQDKRAEAFDLLARAAALRERARVAAKPAGKTDAKAKAQPKRRAPQGKKKRNLRPIQYYVEQDFKKMEAAMKAGDMQAFWMAANKSRALLGRWADTLGRRERTKTPERILKRMEKLEKQVAELRRMLAEIAR